MSTRFYYPHILFPVKEITLVLMLLLGACAPGGTVSHVPGSGVQRGPGEQVRVLELYPGVTATIVAPSQLDKAKRVDLILYALPNGNTTAQTIGRRMVEGLDWHFDIQHIGAQTRALRTMGMEQAVVVYLEADRRSWPLWRSSLGYERANTRIVEIVDQIRTAIGDPRDISVTLTGHSGGGSFAWGFIDGQDALPIGSTESHCSTATTASSHATVRNSRSGSVAIGTTRLSFLPTTTGNKLGGRRSYPIQAEHGALRTG